MRKYLLQIGFIILLVPAVAQTNAFPSSGNVGIGITNPQALLHVYGNNAYLWGLNLGYGTNQAVITTDDNTKGISLQIAGTEYARLNKNGYFGVGTTTPNSNFVVTNLSNTQGLEINQLYSGFSRIFSYNRTANTPIPIAIQDVGSFVMVGTTTNHNNEILQVGGTFYTSGTATFNSQVIIGTPVQSNPNYLLNVTGNIRANKLVVNTTGADFVFAKKYHLIPLDALEKYIQQYKHLPGIEPAREMSKDGMDVGNNETKLLQKIEELTLYMIEMKKENERLENKVEVLNKRITEIGKEKKK